MVLRSAISRGVKTESCSAVIGEEPLTLLRIDLRKISVGLRYANPTYANKLPRSKLRGIRPIEIKT